MDVQLQELIDKIKNDGLSKANEEAAKIVSEAERKAKEIVSEAERNASAVLENAKSEAARIEKASCDAIKQAARNITLSFRAAIEKELSSIILSETEAVYSREMLEKIIPQVVTEWSKKENAKDISVLLGEADLASLEKNLRASLKSKIESGLTIKLDKSLSSGFRIGIKEGAAFFDFSSESLADLFSSYLNPRIAALMKEAEKQ